MISSLDAARTPLERGITLVEASAGTGKTYAIAMLVLRAVCEQEIPIEKILVVTFTRAATEELRGRIRQRLVEARRLLAGKQQPEDATMAAWLETIDDNARPQMKKLVVRALYDIDQAAIFTIHSFCQRMLVEQALESGQLFDVEMQGDIDDIRRQVAEDFWRTTVYPMDRDACGIIVAEYPSPGELLKVLGRASEYHRLEPQSPGVAHWAEKFSAAVDSLRRWFLGDGGGKTLQAFCAAHDARHFKKPLADEENFRDFLGQVSDYLLEKTEHPPLKYLAFLHKEGLLETTSKKVIKTDAQRVQFLERFSLPDEEMGDFIAVRKQLLIAFRRDFLLFLEETLQKTLEERGLLSFDGLIRALDRALSNENSTLRTLLAHRYDAACIDEFQDTDFRQWHIFSSLFAGGDHFLYLIGDPKQGIYAFRGADIYSYFAARNAATQTLTLPKNYRSHPDLVAAVNHLFSYHQKAPFVYRSEQLPFVPVMAAKTHQDGALYHGGESLCAMNYWQLGQNPGRKNWRPSAAAARFCNETMREILDLLDSRNPTILRQVVDGEKQSRPLRPRDIAILVRSHRQVGEYQRACASLGLPCVVTSRASVFLTEEARELLRVLAAVAEPGNPALVRSALAVSWFALSGNDLYDIWEDDRQRDRYLNAFLSYRQTWLEQGVLAMMQRVFLEEGVLAHLAAEIFGERRITNVLQLVELAQKAETEQRLGTSGLLLWLDTAIAEERGEEDAEQQLESDEEAIRIMTMHGSKGLQFPVVFCPFLWYRTGGFAGEEILVRSHENGQWLVDLGSEEFDRRREKALFESLAEELRLFYVAVTRAELRCYVMLAYCQGQRGVLPSAKSALGYLFFHGQEISQQEQEQVFREFAESSGAAYRLLDPKSLSLSRYQGTEHVQGLLMPQKSLGRTLQTDYQMSSYSAMAALGDHRSHAVLPEDEADTASSQAILHRGLPYGPIFGNLIHDCLETISFTAFEENENQETVAAITRLCGRYGIDVDVTLLQRFLSDIVSTEIPLPDSRSFSLAAVDPAQCAKEMGFYFHHDRFRTGEINEILASDPAVTALSATTMRGYLTGFIDLFFQYDGKYYVMDYKTNFLGDTLADYAASRLVCAMAAHNYGLQYWLYTLVAHRHLQNIVPGYQYQRDFGGVLYLFVRGMAPNQPGSGVYSICPDYETLMRLDRTLGGQK